MVLGPSQDKPVVCVDHTSVVHTSIHDLAEKGKREELDDMLSENLHRKWAIHAAMLLDVEDEMAQVPNLGLEADEP